MERIVYCQDDIYTDDLNSVKEEDTKAGSGKEFKFGLVSNQEPTFVQEIVAHTKAYFHVSLQTTVLPHPECYSIYPSSTSRCSLHESFIQYCYAGKSSQRVSLVQVYT